MDESMNLVGLGGRRLSLVTCFWDVLCMNAKRTRIFLRNTETYSNHESPPKLLKSYLFGRNSHVESVWKDTANWQKKDEQVYKVSLNSMLGRPSHQ